jgi:hypothetical protein
MIPTHIYLPTTGSPNAEIKGPARSITSAGRSGLHATSIHTRFLFPHHTLNSSRGTLTLWLFPLEALSQTAHMKHFDQFEADYFIFPILSDRDDLRNRIEAGFHLRFTSDWWRNLVAQFIPWGRQVQGQKAIIAPDHFRFAARQWHQITLTWDRPAGQFSMYVNAVRVATQTQFLPVAHEPAGPVLYAGCPMIALSDLHFYEECASPQQVAELYKTQQLTPNPTLDAHLAHMHAGTNLSTWTFKPDASWTTELDLSLKEPSHLKAFYVQGQEDAHHITEHGMRVATSPEPPGFKGAWTENKVESYYWTHRTFEGDIAIEFDFKLHKPNGLALVMFHAAGMQREDFMADYPLRTNGAMSVVCWENVRNYHWEFYREIDNTRNDTASHLLVKNPWMSGLGYQCLPQRFAQETWHHLTIVQQGPSIKAAINDQLIFDVTDTDHTLNGPLLSFGRVALRAKYKTDMTFRQLRIRTRKPEYLCL